MPASRSGRKRPKIGDIVEITTPTGFAYAQYTHHHPTYGALIRVVNGVFERRPENFAHLMRQKERFSTFFPLGAAVSRNIVSIAAHEEVPPHWQQFPMFKAAGNRDPKTGRVTDWWLWDGESQERIRALAPEQQQLPILAVWNDTLLVERISNGWTPADEV